MIEVGSAQKKRWGIKGRELKTVQSFWSGKTVLEKHSTGGKKKW